MSAALAALMTAAFFQGAPLENLCRKSQEQSKKAEGLPQLFHFQ